MKVALCYWYYKIPKFRFSSFDKTPKFRFSSFDKLVIVIQLNCLSFAKAHTNLSAKNKERTKPHH